MSNGAPRTLRARNSAATRERLLDAATACIERGVEPTMRAVAEAAGVGERTIYRYFDGHDALLEALVPRIQARAGVPLCEDFDGLPAYAEALFGVFEQNRALVVALVASAWMGPRFRGSRRRNLDAMRVLVDAAHPRAPERDRAAGAATLRALLSGSTWVYLRESCGLSREDVLAHARWAIDAVERRLRAARVAVRGVTR